MPKTFFGLYRPLRCKEGIEKGATDSFEGRGRERGIEKSRRVATREVDDEEPKGNKDDLDDGQMDSVYYDIVLPQGSVDGHLAEQDEERGLGKP